MVFSFHKPAVVLGELLCGYLEADGRKALSRQEYTLFPNGFSGIFFNFGSKGALNIKEPQRTPNVSVFGQIDQHFTAAHEPGFYSIGVLFKPTIMSRFLSENCAQFTNQSTDGTLIRSDLQLLHSQLEMSIGVAAKIQVLDHYFEKALQPLYRPPGLVEHAIDLIHTSRSYSIQEIASKLNRSERHVEAQFKQAVGLSPKTYSLIVRFKRMEQQIRDLKTIEWKALDFAHEFYDQNHFIKEFKRFTGHTPSNYLLNNFEMGRSYLVK